MINKFLRIRYTLRSPTMPRRWHKGIAEEIRLPTWTFEAAERGTVAFVRAEEDTAAGPAVARLWLGDATDNQPSYAELEVVLTGRWKDHDEQHPPKSAISQLVVEAEALLTLLGCRSVRAQYVDAVGTRK